MEVLLRGQQQQPWTKCLSFRISAEKKSKIFRNFMFLRNLMIFEKFYGFYKKFLIFRNFIERSTAAAFDKVFTF